MHLARTPALRLDTLASYRAAGKTSIGAIISVLLLVLLVAYLAAFIATSVARIVYPYQADDLEDVALAEVQRILTGQPIYVAPTLEYVPLIYGPVFFYLSAAVAVVTGPNFASVRLVATLASLGAMLLAGLLVRRETGSLVAALVAAGLLAASQPLLNGVLNVGRTDSTCLFFLLAALYVIRTASLAPRVRWWALAAGGCLTGLALLTKQSVAPVGVAIVVYLACTTPTQVVPFLVALCVTVAAPLAVLTVQSGNWPLFYLWDLPRRHELRPDLMPRFWQLDILPRATVPLLLGPVFLIARALSRDWKTVVFYGLIAASMFASAWAPRANTGGARNVLLPAYAILAIMAALGLREGLVQLAPSTHPNSRAFRAYVLFVGLFQCVIMLYAPRPMAPYRSDLWADDRMANKLADLGGSIFAPSYGTYLRGTQSSAQPNIGALLELTGGYGGGMTPQGGQWLGELGNALQQRRYQYVLLDPEATDFFLTTLVRESGYVRAGPLFPVGDQLWTWRRSANDTPAGLFITPKADVYVPRERAPSGGEISSRPLGS